MTTVALPASTYQQFDADHTLDVPGEGYGGWQKTDIELSLDHTAMVVMHAWETGTPEQYPGWHRAVEYLPRSSEIVRTVFPPLLKAVRESGMALYHLASGPYCREYPGYKRAIHLAGPTPELQQVRPDPMLDRLRAFQRDHAFVGAHNQEDTGRGLKDLKFPPAAEPQGVEGVAENAHQLGALCKADGVNHLIYVGFAINWCLLMSAGGMVDMGRRGFMCSTVRQAVTAVENKETARRETCKEIALWRVAISFGFVFDSDDLIRAVKTSTRECSP